MSLRDAMQGTYLRSCSSLRAMSFSSKCLPSPRTTIGPEAAGGVEADSWPRRKCEWYRRGSGRAAAGVWQPACGSLRVAAYLWGEGAVCYLRMLACVTSHGQSSLLLLHRGRGGQQQQQATQAYECEHVAHNSGSLVPADTA